MIARRLFPLLLVLLVAAPAVAPAQYMKPAGPEVTVYGGFNFGGSLDVQDDMLIELKTENSAMVGLGFTAINNPTFALELTWMYRPTQIEGPGLNGQRVTVTDLHSHDFHANFIWHPPVRGHQVNPYFLIGLGATLLDPEAVGPIEPESTTRFSFALGGGAKAYLNKRFGVRGQIRYHATYLSDEAGGVWCDYYYGCYQTVKTNWLDEWGFEGGLIVRLGS